jgi:poly(hydroxyalkanoate) depolymerase family esterase
MRISHRIIYLMIFILCIINAEAKELVRVKKFGRNPGNLKMYIHVPPSFSDSAKVHPVVVVLHGCMELAGRVSLETGWNKLADIYGFYVVYPQQRIANNPQHCFNWFRKRNNTKNKGETASIKSMIDYMLKKYPADTNNIFIYGVSAGGAMTSIMMACYPDLFNTGCVVAGGPYMHGVGMKDAAAAIKNRTPEDWADIVKKQNPGYTGEYPRLIIIHGDEDKIVNIKNAYKLVYQWTSLHKTDTIPDIIDDSFPKYDHMERLVYTNEKGDAVVKFYRFFKIGHQLPVCPGDKNNEGGQIDLFTVKFDFHTTYQVAKDFGLIK